MRRTGGTGVLAGASDKKGGTGVLAGASWVAPASSPVQQAERLASKSTSNNCCTGEDAGATRDQTHTGEDAGATQDQTHTGEDAGATLGRLPRTRRHARLVPHLLAAVLLLSAASASADDAVEFPGGFTLNIETTVDGKPPDTAFDAFRDKLFDWFDRDGDGTLSRSEAARVFPLPLGDGREAKLDPTMEWTREKFKRTLKSQGCTPVVVRVVKADARAMKLGDAAMRLIDRDGDGKLSAEELRRIPSLLKRCDENEDERLTADELLAAVEAKPLAAAGVKRLAAPVNGPELKLDIGSKFVAVPGLYDDGSKSFRLAAGGSRLRFAGGACSLRISHSPAEFRTTREFYSAQFQAVAGNKPAAKSAFEDDATAQVIAGFFDSADRDGDGKLTAKELEAFFDLIEAGLNSRVVIEVEDRGRNLFDRLDANTDGAIDGAELARAAQEWRPDDAIPASVRLVAGRGSPSTSFGPLPLGSAAKPKPAIAKPKTGPRWFDAMDRNADGFVSAAEYLGTPASFAKLDRDADGRVSIEEAEAAGQR